MRDAVCRYCARIGKDPLLVQGPGGNVSWKEGETLWIKASGIWLGDAGRDDIFVPVDLGELRTALEETPHPRLPGGAGGATRRPSIETFMHVVMPHEIVVHLHAIEALAVLVRADAREALQARLGDRFRWEWVEYRQPGVRLARAVAFALRRTPDADVVFLQNHGILVGGRSMDDIDRCVVELSAALKQDLAVGRTPTSSPMREGYPETLHVGPLDYVAVEDARLQSMVHIPALYRRLSEAWALYPDHVVFLGPRAPVFETRSDAASHGRTHRPPLLFIHGEGVFARQGFDEAQHAQLGCYYEVLARQKPQDVLVELNRQDIHDLVHWEAEQYRKNASAP